jgi:hypothetical protein
MKMHLSLALTLATVLATLPVVSSAADLTPDEQAFFDQHTSDFLRFETQRLDAPAMEKVFSTPFYAVKVVIKEGADGEQRSSLVVARIEDKLVSVSSPSSDGDLPDLQKMLNPEFKLATPADAETLQEALDAVYPIVMDRDKKIRNFRRAGSQWMFVRGTFFDAKSGYIFETDGKGTITAVKYQLKLP